MELSPNSITTERRADMIWAVFMTAPLIYILTSISITEAGGLDSFDHNSLRFLSSLNTGDGARRILLAFSISCVLSGAIAIYGFIPTLLSGSLQYILGFSGVSWILLVLLRI